MNKINWLLTEVDQWVREGVIVPGQATKIKNRYPTPGEAISWGKIIFLSSGAILIGLGVILLFAYNWEKMHTYIKLAAIIFSLLAAHGTGVVLRRPGSKNPAAGEALHVLGTMLFGAGIWLIAQIYHIDEHYPNAFLIWGMGALALAWVLPSISHGILAAILLLLWNGFETFDFRDPGLFAPILIMGGILALAWLHRSRALLGVGIASFLLTLYFSCSKLSNYLGILVIFFSACTLIALGIMNRGQKRFPQSAPLFLFFGNLLYMAFLYGLSFPKHGMLFFTVNFQQPLQALYFSIFALAAMGSWGMAIGWLYKNQRTETCLLRIDYLAVPLAFIVILLNTLGLLALSGWTSAALFNMLFLFHCIMWIAQGCKTIDIKSTTIGCLLLALISATRYTDLFESLIVRSLIFFLVGAAIFTVGIFYSKSKKQLQEKTS